MQPYVAMKGALIPLTKTMPLDYAVDGNRVNTICGNSPKGDVTADAERTRFYENKP